MERYRIAYARRWGGSSSRLPGAPVRARFRESLLALSLALSLAAATALIAPAPATAHTELRSSSPADSAHLSEVPREVRLRFSGPVELAFSALELIGPDGRLIALEEPVHPGDSAEVVVARLRTLAMPGTYTVRWRTAAADGHPLRGSFTFTVSPGAAGLPGGEPLGVGAQPPAEHHPAAAMDRANRFDAASPLYVAVRWLTFVALLGLIGAVAFRVLVLGLLGRGGTTPAFFASADTGAARLGLVATGILIGATLLRLYAQSVAVHGAGLALDPGRLGAMLTGTTWGLGWLLQACAVVVALIGLLLHGRHPAPGWGLALFGATGLAFTPALSGHAASLADGTGVAILVDGLHVLGAGGWLGSLLATVAVGIPAALRLKDRRGEAVAALINAFSPTALAFATVVLATGVVSAWLHLGSVSALWESGYGRTLLLKLAFFSVVFTTAAYNWLRVKPRLGHLKAANHLRGSAAVELTAGLVVLLVTAVLVGTPPPRDLDSARVKRPAAAALPEP